MSGAGEGRPLRIGVCAPYDLGRDGGVNSHIRAQARALRRLGHDVRVFGASSAPLIDGELALSTCVSLTIGGTETGIGIDPRAWWRVAALFRAARFDLLHLHEPLMPLVPWFALRQAAVPVVATFHTHRDGGHRWYGPYQPLLAPLMRRVATRLAVSGAAHRTVARDFPGRYEIVPNGIDVDRFRAPAARPAAMPERLRFVLFVGRLEPRKGVDRLIRAMTIVQAHAPDARLVMVGDGPDRLSLEALAREAQIGAAFAGRVPDDLLPAYYRAADIVCSPALGDESFGIVLLEAMAAERPIVATRIDGYAELLDRAGSGRLVDVDDPVALAREIIALLDAPDLRRTLGARGAAFVRDYDWDPIARRLETIYRTALADAGCRLPTGRSEDRPLHPGL
ncbi:MAG: glycosyltransferase family 4 protein [Acidobacteriota bacterium]